MSHPLLIAVQFLTRLPVRIGGVPSNIETGRSLLYYPLVGVMIGALLVALAWMLGSAPSLLSAALVLACWVMLTGGLHLDGLADSADAWLGGLNNREKTLAIMKDPNCGPAGVVAIVLVLLIKIAALHAIIDTENLSALLLAATLGRTALPLLFLTTPYARPTGLGTALATYLPRRAAVAVIVAVGIAVIFIAGTKGLWLIVALIVAFVLLRSIMMQRLGGTTGDTAGALVEITETSALVAVVLIE